jgi:hypothetical protein
MPLLLSDPEDDYAEGEMTSRKSGAGPWGEAIRYWMGERGIKSNKALAEKVRATDGGKFTEKTAGNLVKGGTATTTTLRRVARALNVPIEQVLISPERRLVDTDREALDRIASIQAQRLHDIKSLEATLTVDTVLADMKQIIDAHAAEIDALKAQLPQTKPRHKRR